MASMVGVGLRGMVLWPDVLYRLALRRSLPPLRPGEDSTPVGPGFALYAMRAALSSLTVMGAGASLCGA